MSVYGLHSVLENLPGSRIPRDINGRIGETEFRMHEGRREKTFRNTDSPEGHESWSNRNADQNEKTKDPEWSVLHCINEKVSSKKLFLKNILNETSNRRSSHFELFNELATLQTSTLPGYYRNRGESSDEKFASKRDHLDNGRKMPPRVPIRAVNRVHAPENDMHATLPLRGKLLQHLQKARSPHLTAKPTIGQTNAPPSKHLPKLTILRQSIRDLPPSSAHFHRMLTTYPPFETRILALEALQYHPLPAVLPTLAPVLPTLPDDHLAAILDRITRIQTSHDPESASRTERIARGLGLRISRGAYIKLVRSSHSQHALLHAHACLAVGHSLNTALLNALLRSGVSPTRILAEFQRRELVPNGETAESVLRSVGIHDGVHPDTWARVAGSVIAFVAREDARKGVGLLGVALARGVPLQPGVFDHLVIACLRQERTEAALKVWREKRRFWMGGLGRAARTEVVRSGLVRLRDPRWEFLVDGVTERERVRLTRVSRRVMKT